MSMQTGSIDADGLARTTDGKLYVTLGSGSTITSPTLVTPTGVPYSLSKSGIPFIKASSGTMGNNGAVSAMTALPKVFSSGAYLWLPAGAIAAGVPAAPAWYWFVASSTTAGTVFNSTYTSGTPAVGVATPFVTTGPGAFVGSTATITGPSLSIPAGSLGVNGRIEVDLALAHNTAAGNKTYAIVYGGVGSTMWTATQTNQVNAIVKAFAQNRGILTVQSCGGAYAVQTSAANGTLMVDGTENTANAVPIALTMLADTATNHTIIESYSVNVIA